MKDILIILASNSPRRKELLKQIGLDFVVIPSSCDENLEYIDVKDIVIDLSEKKALDVVSKLEKEDLELNLSDIKRVLVLGSDTLVSHRGEVLGKPLDIFEAKAMLKSLSNDHNEIYTGVCLVLLEKEDTRFKVLQIESFYEKTEVYFDEMSEADIDEYIATGEALDKAGAYGIQGFAARYINKINGDYNNVVGLPVSKVWYNIKKLCGDE